MLPGPDSAAGASAEPVVIVALLRFCGPVRGLDWTELNLNDQPSHCTSCRWPS
jgi:hypothetical protein